MKILQSSFSHSIISKILRNYQILKQVRPVIRLETVAYDHRPFMAIY